MHPIRKALSLFVWGEEKVKFKTKPIEVEAWREGCGEPTPEWFNDFVISGPVHGLPDNISQVWNKNHNSWVDFGPTDWLIYNGPDDILPCDEETFEKKYEVVK